MSCENRLLTNRASNSLRCFVAWQLYVFMSGNYFQIFFWLNIADLKTYLHNSRLWVYESISWTQVEKYTSRWLFNITSYFWISLDYITNFFFFNQLEVNERNFHYKKSSWFILLFGLILLYCVSIALSTTKLYHRDVIHEYFDSFEIALLLQLDNYWTRKSIAIKVFW